jgi:hypothetical protein
MARSALLTLSVIALITVVMVSRHNLPGEVLAHSQDVKKPQKWEYCYVSDAFTSGSPDKIVYKVWVSQGGEISLADSDRTGIAALNKLGADGWELVSASNEISYRENVQMNFPATTRYLLKRPK